MITPPKGVTLDKTEFPLPPLGQQATHTERVRITSSHSPDQIFPIKVEVLLDSGVRIVYERMISFYECIRTAKGLNIDGDLSDWPPETQYIHLGSEEQYIAGYVEWEGPEDSSARVYTSWDKDWFYLGVEFQDDRLSSPCAGFTVYNNDGIEIYFDTDHEGDRDEARYSDDDHQYGFSLEQGKAVVYSWSQLGTYSKDSRITLNLNPVPAKTLSGRAFKGAIMEGAIPLKELKIKPRDGLQIGFNLARTDDDDPRTIHPFFQEIQFSWARRKNSWQNPQVFGDLFFVDPSNTGALKTKERHTYIDDAFFLPSDSGPSDGTRIGSAN